METPSRLKRDLELENWMAAKTEARDDLANLLSPPASSNSGRAFGRFQNDIKKPGPRTALGAALKADGSFSSLSSDAQHYLDDKTSGDVTGDGPLQAPDIDKIDTFLSSPQGRRFVADTDRAQALDLYKRIGVDVGKTRFGGPLLEDPTSYAILAKIYNAYKTNGNLLRVLNGETVSNDGGGNMPSPAAYTLPADVLSGARPASAADLAHYVKTYKYGDQIEDPTRKGNLNVVYRDVTRSILGKVPDPAALDPLTPEQLDDAYRKTDLAGWARRGLMDPSADPDAQAIQRLSPTTIRTDRSGSGLSIGPALPDVGPLARSALPVGADSAPTVLAVDPATGRVVPRVDPLGLPPATSGVGGAALAGPRADAEPSPGDAGGQGSGSPLGSVTAAALARLHPSAMTATAPMPPGPLDWVTVAALPPNARAAAAGAGTPDWPAQT